MDLLDRFDVALDLERRRDGVPALLPSHLSRACARAMSAQGAGISLVAQIRIPLGWSSDDTRVAEALQTTLGQGPCLTAVAEGRLLVADEPEMVHRWPQFTDLVLRQTPFRSLASLPLLMTPDLHGAVDVYWTDSAAANSLDQTEAFLLAGRVGQLLLDGAVDDVQQPGLLGAEAPQRRLRLWTATGLVAADLTLEPPDAIAAIRGWALQHEILLDDAVEQLVSRRLTPRDLLWEDIG